MKRQGFTLIELMVVISIIAILASILFPLFARARETARRSGCASNLAQLGVALNMYAQAYDGHYPPKNNDFRPIYRYARNSAVFLCPSDADHDWESANKESASALGTDDDGLRIPSRVVSSYVYKGGLTNDVRADTAIASETKAYHTDLVNVLFAAGHVRAVPAEVFKPVVPPEKELPAPAPSPPPSPEATGGGKVPLP